MKQNTKTLGKTESKFRGKIWYQILPGNHSLHPAKTLSYEIKY
jgi:hypothetical protein